MKTIIYCRNRWPHRFLLLLLLPIWRDEWISSSSNFSSLSHVFIYPFFPPLLFSLLNPSHPPSFRPIRHTLIFGVLHPHSPPPIYNRVTFILLLSSLQSSSITSSIPPFSVAFSSLFLFITCRCSFFFPLLSSLVAFFKVCFHFYFFHFLLYCFLIPIKHLTYIMWYDLCVCWKEAQIWWKKVQIKHFRHSVKKWERKGAGGRKRA